VIKGESIVVWKLCEFLVAYSKGSCFRDLILAGNIREGKAIQMITENRLWIDLVGLEGEILTTGLTEKNN
jgi:hypothetical protein